MGDNLALNADATASSYIDPYTPDRAVNGITNDPTSRWLCTAPGWLQLDLKRSCWVSQWTLKSMGGNAGWPLNYCVTVFKLLSSQDGSNWNSVDSVANNENSTCMRNIPNPVRARYFRVVVGGMLVNASAGSIMELELIEADVVQLSSLVIKDKEDNAVVLSPSFNSDTLSYTSDMGYDTDIITVIPVATDSTAVITVNGQTLLDGKAAIALNIGQNQVELKVTSSGGTIVTYLVAVTRASSPYLSSVKFAGLRFSGFVKTTYHYDLSTSTLNRTEVVPVAEDLEADVAIRLNDVIYSSGQEIPLNNGMNPINVVVTSKTGSDSRTYLFNINKIT